MPLGLDAQKEVELIRQLNEERELEELAANNMEHEPERHVESLEPEVVAEPIEEVMQEHIELVAPKIPVQEVMDVDPVE